MNSLIYSFSVYLFNTYSVLVDSKDTVMSKTQPVSLFTEHLFWKRKADKKKTNMICYIVIIAMKKKKEM